MFDRHRTNYITTQQPSSFLMILGRNFLASFSSSSVSLLLLFGCWPPWWVCCWPGYPPCWCCCCPPYCCPTCCCWPPCCCCPPWYPPCCCWLLGGIVAGPPCRLMYILPAFSSVAYCSPNSWQTCSTRGLIFWTWLTEWFPLPTIL